MKQKKEITITKHAAKRLKERNGFNKSSLQRMAQKAYDEGIPYENMKGRLKKWATRPEYYQREGNNIRLYGDKLYVFVYLNLVTVLQVPPNIMKNIDKMVIIEV